jgi:hypothetical protein
MVWKRITLYSDKYAACFFRTEVFRALTLAALRCNLSVDVDGNDGADIF